MIAFNNMLLRILLCFLSIFLLVHGNYIKRPKANHDISQQSILDYTCGPCPNGHCTGPETCICDDGFSLDTNLDCAPVCTQACLNGECIAPNECVCKPGFRQDPTSVNICAPECPSGCVNGACVKGSCQCSPGYEYTETNSSGKCSPICKTACENGVCAAPEKCKCHPGYEKVVPGNRCEPICSILCLNAECIAPETYKCNPGYRLDGNSNTTCWPVCSGCKSGNCVAPDVCECFDGYRPVTNSAINETDCAPICEPPCVKGKCIAAGVCWPDLGQQNTLMSDEGSLRNNTCAASCKGKCEEGKCISDRGFELAMTDATEPVRGAVCKSTCGNGTCVAPDKCKCKPGYEQKYVGQTCQAVCRNGCFNGACVTPEQCECNAGYKFDVNSTHSCSPLCSNGCDSGTCIGPDVCQCFPGYSFITNTTSNRTSCQLNCRPTCENGTCKVSELCEPRLGGTSDGIQPCGSNCSECRNGVCLQFCEFGYELIGLQMNITKCRPICDAMCVNAVCSAPGVCSCLEGYEHGEGNMTCRPVCKLGCKHGVCIAPGVCKCQRGYIYNGTGCMPHCTIDCVNGTCIKSDTCYCDDGYVIAAKGNNTATWHCMAAPEGVQGLENAEASGGSSNNAVYIALSVLAGSGVVAAAFVVYWLKFYKVGSYSTQEVCQPGQINSSF